MTGDEACDLLIVGGGLAGLSAALYGGRFGLRTVLLEHLAAGGQVLNVERIDDYPGFPEGVSGFDRPTNGTPTRRTRPSTGSPILG